MTIERSPTAGILAGLLGVLAALAAAGCAPPLIQAAPAAASPSAMAPLPSTTEAGMRVEKMREQLQLAPWDLAFSAVRGAGQVTETVTARNLTDDLVTVRALLVLGDDAAQFQLRTPPKLPASIPPKGQLSVEVTFAPPADAVPGVHRALLRFQTGATAEDGPGTDLSALAILGHVGDDEPSLAQIVESLGYAVDVHLAPRDATPAADPRPQGDEIAAPLFTRATPTLVALNPVARFSADGPRPFGHYLTEGSAVRPVTLATLAAGQHQTLNPDLESGGNASFDPGGDAPFGVWVKAGQRTLYTEDQRNSGADKHVVRVFPLHARGGAPIPHAYLLAFKDSTTTDAYQDYVFVLWNVTPAPTP